ncbi:MAG TPA: hypothetical protein VGM44_14975 [Polyangiaceae bacterium]|jgi:hypothetical protein
MRSLRRRTFVVSCALAVTALLSARAATARVGGESEYTKAQTYSGALRYLRIDLGYEVIERDPDAAYLIFRYQLPGEKKATATGTVEVVEAEGHVRLFVQIPTMPEYHERVLRDGLVRKLRDEYGEPVRKPPATPPRDKKPDEKKPDNDADAGSD